MLEGYSTVSSSLQGVVRLIAKKNILIFSRSRTMITIADSKFSIASFDFIGRRKHNSMTTKNFVTLKAEDSAMVAFDLKLWLFNFLVAIKILKKLVAIKIFLTVLSIPFATFFSYSIKFFRKNNSFFEKKTCLTQIRARSILKSKHYLPSKAT